MRSNSYSNPMVDARHAHARNCKQSINDCEVCQNNIKYFQSLSLSHLSMALGDVKASRLKSNIAAGLVEKFLDHHDGRVNISNRRKKSDIATMALLKGYEQRGGVI